MRTSQSGFTAVPVIVLAAFLAAEPATAQLPIEPLAAISAEQPFLDTHTVAGDLDHDGDLDVVGFEAESDGTTPLLWWENTGDADPTTWPSHRVYSFPFVDLSTQRRDGVRLGDVDGDGDLDVVSGHSPYLMWFENDGDPAEDDWSRHVISSDAWMWIFQVGDVDGDGDLDVVVGSGIVGDETAVWQNDGGGWSHSPIGLVKDGAVHGLALADLDGDGDLDVLETSAAAGSLSWLVNSDSLGDRGGWSEVIHSFGGDDPAPWAVRAVDLDGDGDVDPVVSVVGDEEIVWLENDGTPADGGFQYRQLDDDCPSFGLVVADLDRDGDPDVVAPCSDPYRVTWWQNDGTPADGGFVRGEVAAPDLRDLAVVDLDSDGDRDLVTAGSVTGLLEQTAIHRTARFAAPLPVDALDARELAAADVDRDGRLDLVGLTDPGVAIWRASGDGSSWSATMVDATVVATALDLGDLDHDGDPDLLVAGDAGVVWYENDEVSGGTWPERSAAPSLNSVSALAIVDLDGDGALDAVVADSASEELIRLGNSSGDGSSWFTSPMDLTVPGVADLGGADLDGDGLPEVAAVTDAGLALVWTQSVWGSDRGIGFARFEVASDLTFPSDILLEDVDGDGDRDLVVGDDGGVTAFSHDGFGGFERDDIDSQAATALAIGDLDLDGDRDVAVAGSGGLAWLERLPSSASRGGVSTSWQSHVLDASATSLVSLLAVDLDHEGDPDLVGASPTGVHWRSNDGGSHRLDDVALGTGGLVGGERAALLAVELAHLGRSDDAAVRWASLALGLEGAPGVPLTQGELDASIDRLEIVRDDPAGTAPGALDPGDPVALSVADPSVDGSGVVELGFDADEPLAVVDATEQVSFFVVLVLEDGPTIDRLLLDHVGESALVEDPRTGAVLPAEPPKSGVVVDVAIGAGAEAIFTDGFESGDFSAWSSASGR